VTITFDQRVMDVDYSGDDGMPYCKDVAPGAAWWGRNSEGLIVSLHFACPCGCGSLGGTQVKPTGWAWNGSETKPTLTPSIQFLSKCRWHGYLADGEWVRC